MHKAYLGFLWCYARTFISSPSGRHRYNVLGALDAVTKEVITFTNEDYINSTSVCALLDKIFHGGGKAIPITVVMDNARYQRCELVKQHAKKLNIELLFLPSYSPHLNLIERLWKFVKKECLYSVYYESFAEFKKAINCLLYTSPSPRD